MKLSRFYCEKIEGNSVELDQVESHHLMHVMRIAEGSQVELFDGKGIVARGTAAKKTKKIIRVDIESKKIVEPRKSGRVIIAAAIAKAHRFDLIISKCTEIGVDCIVPLIFERSVKQAKGSSALERYKKLSIVAAKQCGRVFLPEIASPCSFESGLTFIKERFPGSKAVFGGFSDKSVGIGGIADLKSDISAFIGPEGGMTENEEKKLNEIGADMVRLTDTILRTETACIAFASLLCTLRDNPGV